MTTIAYKAGVIAADTGICAGSSDSSGQMRCVKCNVTWDRDDVMVCPGEVPLAPVVATRAHDEDADRSNRFVSALAPDRFSRR